MLPAGPYISSLRELLLGWHMALASPAALRAATRLSRLVLWRTALQEEPQDPGIDMSAEAGEALVEALAAMPALRRMDDDMKRPGKSSQGGLAVAQELLGRLGATGTACLCWAGLGGATQHAAVVCWQSGMFFTVNTSFCSAVWPPALQALTCCTQRWPRQCGVWANAARTYSWACCRAAALGGAWHGCRKQRGKRQSSSSSSRDRCSSRRSQALLLERLALTCFAF